MKKILLHQPEKDDLKWKQKFQVFKIKRKTLFTIDIILLNLNPHNWQKWKRAFLTCPCREIYRDKEVGLKSCKYSLKNTIYVNMWNLGQFRENLIFCQQLINWSSNLPILLHMCDTYNCDYLQHSTFRFNDRFLVKYRFPFPILRFFYRKITYSVTLRSVSQENAFKKSKNPSAFPPITICSNNSFTLIENNFWFLR